MDGRGGCCIARYAIAGASSGGGGGGANGFAYDLSKMDRVDRIMLRYRPIAPKPAVGGGPVFREDNVVSSKIGGGRCKRRCVKENNSNKRSCGRRRKASSPPEKRESEAPVPVVTLPLLPETPDRKDSPARGSSSESAADVAGGFIRKMVKNNINSPIWLSFGENYSKKLEKHVSVEGGHVTGYEAMISSPGVVVRSWVKVECVTDTWVDMYGLGCTDEERVMNLHKDTCPGFVSDCANMVRWTNGAYKDIVGCEGKEGRESEEVMVALGLKDGVELPFTCPAFTCRVKVVAYKKDKIKNENKSITSITLPCDVWRMDNGGFAWKLDTEAALSLGR